MREKPSKFGGGRLLQLYDSRAESGFPGGSSVQGGGYETSQTGRPYNTRVWTIGIIIYMQREDPEASERQTLRMATAVSLQLVQVSDDAAGTTRGGSATFTVLFTSRGGNQTSRSVRSSDRASVAAAINCS